MSLQVWLPLNGDLRNQGLAGPLTAVGTPTYTNGKMGKALSSGGCKMSAEMTNKILNNQAVSICCWIYPNVDTGTASSHTIFGNSSMQANNNRKFSIFLYPTVNDLHLSWQNDIEKVTFLASKDNEVFPSYVWTHLAVVYENPNVYIYINGTLIRTYTNVVSNSSTFAYETSVISNDNNRMVNDLRIYNHALSTKEVKEISKGMVLHYPLNNNGLGNPNLIVNSQQLGNRFYTAGTSKWEESYTIEDDREIWTATCITAGSGGVHTFLFPKTTDKMNKKYTWSCWVKGNRNFDIVIGHECGGTAIRNITTQWQYTKHTWAFTDNTYHSFVWYTRSSWVVGDWIKVKDFKIEEGEKATPWCPNEADDLYSNWGMDSLIEYDCSGYGNNGKKSAILKTSPDSPRYQTSSVFSGSQFIAAGRGAMVTDAITVSWWGYMDNWANYTRAISCTESGGWNFEPNNNKMAFSLFCNNKYVIIIGSLSLSSYSPGWHHFVGTYDGYKTCLYRDGVLKSTSIASTTKYPITYNSTNGLFIGAEAGGNPTTPAGAYFNGQLSDVRIYATALSADDVKELYQFPISIDKNGNSFANEFLESESPKFHKSGIIENSYIHENEADDTDSLETFHINKTSTFANQIYEI